MSSPRPRTVPHTVRMCECVARRRGAWPCEGDLQHRWLWCPVVESPSLDRDRLHLVLQEDAAVQLAGVEPGGGDAADGGVRGRPVAHAADVGPAQQRRPPARAQRPRQGASLQCFCKAVWVLWPGGSPVNYMRRSRTPFRRLVCFAPGLQHAKLPKCKESEAC